MTLIVYSNGSLYADNCVGAYLDNYCNHYQEGEKMFLSPDNKIAFAMSGPLPHKNHLKCIFETLSIIGRILVLERTSKQEDDERKKGRGFINSLVDGLLKNHPAIFLVMSKADMFRITEGNKDGKFEHLWNDVEVVEGSGKSAFLMCRKAGLSIPESYEKIALMDSMVNANPRKITQTSLSPFNFKRKQ